jgi:hypothetical protein
VNTISRFYGINSSAPAVVQGVAGSYTFPRPAAFGVNSGTTAGASYGSTAMPGMLLDLPGSGVLNGQPFRIVAAGNVIVPAGATSPTFNIALNQNTFSFSQDVLPGYGRPYRTDDFGGASKVTTTSTTLATLASAQSLTAGTKVPFSLKVDFLADGAEETVGVSFVQRGPEGGAPGYIPPGTQTVSTGSGLLTGRYSIEINGVYNAPADTTVLSNFDAFSENPPPAQLSLVASFGGTLSGTNLFVANLEQFDLQA